MIGQDPAADRLAAAAARRRLLEAVENGTLEAVGPAAGLLRQMQGAAASLELADDSVVQLKTIGYGRQTVAPDASTACPDRGVGS